MTEQEARFIRICTLLALDEKSREELRAMIEFYMKHYNDWMVVNRVRENILGPRRLR